MVNRRTIVAAVAAVLFCTTINTDALATPFLPGDSITYSQDSWGAAPSPGNAAQVLLDNFDFVYPGGALEVGIPGIAGFSLTFSGANAALNYLPAGGGNASLSTDYIDPSLTESGNFGGQVLALQLDVDFSDSGILIGSAATRFGDLTLINLSSFAPTDLSGFDGLTVRQFLANANTRLGDGPGLYTIDNIASLTEALTRAFEGGTPTQFAQNHLLVAPAQVPEPATLALLGIGLAGLTTRRLKGKGRSHRSPVSQV